MAAARGASGKRDLFGALYWKYILQIARFRSVTVVFVYSHCGFGTQDLVDKEANRAAEMTFDEIQSKGKSLVHPIWWVDRARIQQSAIRQRRQSDLNRASDRARKDSRRLSTRSKQTSTALLCTARPDATHCMRYRVFVS